MARDFGPVNVAIWADPAWRDLPPAAQHLYLLLWTSPGLTYAGTHDWRPNRLAKLSKGFTAEHTQTVANCLSARHFLVVDAETEEVLVRSWARFDELLKKPRMAVSYANAYASVASPILRSVLAHETKKMHDLWPDLACWGDKRVAQILDHPAVSAKDLPVPEDPFMDGFTDGFALGLPQTLGKVCPSVYLPPTPTPTPTPNHSVVKGGVGGTDATPTRKRAAPLSDDWKPTEAHRTLAAERGVDADLEADRMRDWAKAKGETGKDWDARFRNWLRNAKPGNQPQVARPLPTTVPEPPDGLTDDEMRAWRAKHLPSRSR